MDADVITNTTLLDVRGGLNYYHNVTLVAGRRPQHQHRDRHSWREPRRLHQRPHAGSNIGGYTNPTLGFSPSQPWDRSEKTWNVADHADAADGHAHAQVRRRVAQQQGRAAADAGRRRPARALHLQRGRDRVTRRSGVADRHRELARRVPARLAERRRARPEGDRRTRHQALGDRRPSSTTSGRRDPTSRSTSGCAGSTTTRSSASKGRARSPTTIPPSTRFASRASAARPTP